MWVCFLIETAHRRLNKHSGFSLFFLVCANLSISIILLLMLLLCPLSPLLKNNSFDTSSVECSQSGGSLFCSDGIRLIVSKYPSYFSYM